MAALLDLAIGTKIGRIVTGALAVVLAIIGFRVWLAAHDAAKYNQGYTAGELHERAAWEAEQQRKIAEAEAERLRKQDQLDKLETAYLNAQNRAHEAEASLAKANAESKTKDDLGLPRSVGRELNKIGRW
ncbi:hypothetical protein EOA64_00480 [Mesorhizobium sp. M1A.F.Ca.IN.022.02.1.1]|uniref:hypothetical protein n=1 Tax=Mesorhizobium sp. M1A.F.Ca.IN.022.02.1.1 TaxID=2496766 RepID=UPI000FCB30C0|nr:hypothetical protein [Mesorhizobium sp. M1A.F.Ca.IN.022.02.1.1]RUV65854.1 hypothetical protein EOA64_00480 [Mesorhizobium sp. M1A.F.Ca.IN.022.02.1.1]